MALLGNGYFSNNRGIWSFEFDEGSGDWSPPILLRGLDSLMLHGFSAAISPGGSSCSRTGENDEDILNGEIYFLETASP